MKLAIKRNTGVMGGLARISFMVDGKERIKLGNEEEQMMVVHKDEVELQVKQLFLRSKKVQVTHDQHVEIRVNRLCAALYILAFFTLYLAINSYGGNQQLVFTGVGSCLLLIAIVYSWTAYYRLELIDAEKKP